MPEWKPRPDAHWLKSVGASGWPLADDWFEHVPNETTEIRFSGKRPASIRVGDPLVYYAAGHLKLFGIIEVFTSPVEDGGGDGRWPWVAEVRSKVIIKQLERAPNLDILTEVDPMKDWHKYVQQMDYRTLGPVAFEHVARRLVEAADVTCGDILDATFAAAFA